MSNTVGFYCGPGDNRALTEFALSIGLHLLPMMTNQIVDDDPAEGPICYLSLVPLDQTHPYGPGRLRLADVLDPMLMFQRSYHQTPYLVSGRVICNTDNDALAAQTLPYFHKIARWVRANWSKHGDHGWYLGPEAAELLEQGAEPVEFLPGEVTMTVVGVGPRADPSRPPRGPDWFEKLRSQFGKRD